MKRIGIIKSIDHKTVTLIGFGEFNGNKLVANEDLGIEIEVPVFKLDSGTILENTYGYYWGEEVSIKQEIAEYESKNYTIHLLNI